MKLTRYSEVQIIAILRQAEGGMPVAERCREQGMSNAPFYKWRARYGGMDASLISQMKAMEAEDRRLNRMFAALNVQADLLTGLTDANKTWGFGLCFVHMRNVKSQIWRLRST